MPNLIRQIVFERPTPQRIDWAVPRDVDPLVATWTAVFYTEQTRTIRAPERRRIDHLQYFGDANNGPSVLDEPSFAWCQKVTEPYIINTIMPPNNAVPDSYRARDPRRIDVKEINEPETDWLENFIITQAPFDPSIYQGIQDELRAIRSREQKKLYGTVDEPEFGWLWEDTVEPFIASTIMPPVYEMPAEYRTPEAGKVKILAEPETDWLANSLIVTFDPTIYTGVWDELRALRSREPQKIRGTVTEPDFGWPFDVGVFVMPAFERSYRTPEAPKLKVIYGPDDSPWIFPLTSQVVTFDPALWPAIEKQLHALRTNERRKIEAWLAEPEFTWQYLVNDARNAILFPGTREPSFRARDRALLELRKMYLSDFGWLTFNIPAPPAIATGKHNKRKWRRSG